MVRGAPRLGPVLTGGPSGTIAMPRPFVSYAQNREDVVLWRALRDFGAGFYVDVGASDPVAESVTKGFSELGWRGINIEPMHGPFERLVEDRPRDVNLNLAVENWTGTRQYYNVADGDGLSTGVEWLAERYRSAGFAVEPVETVVDTLANVCARFVDGDIHFMKIDAEGSEGLALAGADFERFRPWILVVEAVSPEVAVDAPEAGPRRVGADQLTHPDWEPSLVACGYRFVLFDGLNRFYVAQERDERLGPDLAVTANIFDEFVSARERDAERRFAEERSALVARLEETERARAAMAAEVDAIRSTVSWQVTRPLRALRRLQPGRTRAR